MLNLENADIGIQKSGRLTSETLDWLNENVGTDFKVCSDPFDATREITDRATGITIVGYSNVDILKAAVSSQVDVAVCGSDKLAEAELTDGSIIPRPIKWMGVGLCRMVLARPLNAGDKPIRSVVTSYPKQAELFVSRKCKNVPQVDYFGGGIEMITRRGGYDALVDIVSTGETLRRNGMKEEAFIKNCGAIMVASISQQNPGWIVSAGQSGISQTPRGGAVYVDWGYSDDEGGGGFAH